MNIFYILIVDDNKNNLFTLRTLLNEHIEAKIIEADSGEDALKIALQEPINLIILDVQMPGMDGFETAEITDMTGFNILFKMVFVGWAKSFFLPTI